MEVLVINGHDYTRFVESKGVGWSREDLDTDKTVRTKDGLMRRDKITEKRKLSYKMMNMKQGELAQLDDDLSNTFFDATYADLHGVQTRTFYCSSFNATLSDILDGNARWEGATFNIIEK